MQDKSKLPVKYPKKQTNKQLLKHLDLVGTKRSCISRHQSHMRAF